MREKLRKTGSPGLVISQLDEVAWLFNLRGSDIDYNPVSARGNFVHGGTQNSCEYRAITSSILWCCAVRAAQKGQIILPVSAICSH